MCQVGNAKLHAFQAITRKCSSLLNGLEFCDNFWFRLKVIYQITMWLKQKVQKRFRKGKKLCQATGGVELPLLDSKSKVLTITPRGRFM